MKKLISFLFAMLVAGCAGFVVVTLLAGCEGRVEVEKIVTVTETDTVLVEVCKCPDDTTTDCEASACPGETIREYVCQINGEVVSDPSECPDPPPRQPGLYVRLASDTPASMTVPPGSASVTFIRLQVEAVGGEFPLSRLIFRLGGVGVTSNVDEIYLYAHDFPLGYRLSEAYRFDPDTREVSIDTGFRIPEGTAFDYAIRVNVGNLVNNGDTARLELVAVQTDGYAFGEFPILGNTMTFTDQRFGTLVVTKDSFPDPTADDVDATIAQMIVLADGEDAMLAGLTFHSTEAMDRSQDIGTHASYALWDDAAKIVDCWTITQYLILCPMRTDPYPLLADEPERLRLRTRLAGNPSDVTRVAIEEKADVHAVGGTFGFNMAVDISGYDDVADACAGEQSDCSYSTIMP